MSETTAAALPRTPEEALQLVEVISVPTATLIAWMNIVAGLPAGHAADLFISIRQQINDAITRVADYRLGVG